jgi:hypothetical protein
MPSLRLSGIKHQFQISVGDEIRRSCGFFAPSHLPEEIKLKACVALVATGLSVSLFFPSLALAKSLSKADIEGKKICFGNVSNSFSRGGRVGLSRCPRFVYM